MKFMNSEIRWAGRTYRAPAGDDGDGDGGGDGGGGEGGDDGAGDGGAGDGGDGGSGDGGGDGDGGGAGDGDGDGGEGGATWRQELAGDNEAWGKRLERYTDINAFVEASMQAHDKLRAGEVSTGLPENPTDEQLAAYREANGIPESPDKYEWQPGDRELSDVDLEMLGPVAAYAHEHHIPQDVLNGLMTTYMAETDKVVEQMHTQDNLDAQEFTKVAKENWGAEYQINMNRANNQINLLPEAIRDSFKQARMPDGRGLMNSPEIMNWLVGIDRQVSPMDPIKGGAEATLNDARKVVEESKARMRDDSVNWHKDKPAQERFMQAQQMIDQFEGSQ